MVQTCDFLSVIVEIICSNCFFFGLLTGRLAPEKVCYASFGCFYLLFHSQCRTLCPWQLILGGALYHGFLCLSLPFKLNTWHLTFQQKIIIFKPHNPVPVLFLSFHITMYLIPFTTGFLDLDVQLSYYFQFTSYKILPLM